MSIEAPDRPLVEQVRELRSWGRSPKQIAHALGVPPATVAPLVRALAAEQQASAEGTDATAAEVLGCWVNPGWSTGLTVAGHSDWPDTELPEVGQSGLACALVARRGRGNQASVCGYLVDVYCLGVKNAVGPVTMHERNLLDYRRMFFGAFPEAPLEVPLELVRHLVFGGVDYARSLGFDPHEDFGAAAGNLGEWTGSADIEFGRDGKPFYVEGPDDAARQVIATLRRSVGEDNFTFVMAAGMP